MIVGIEIISRGTLVHPREVFKGALLANAYAIILAHHHPSGNTEQSLVDKVVTEKLTSCGNLLEIQVLDHVVIGCKGGYFSIRESGAMNS